MSAVHLIRKLERFSAFTNEDRAFLEETCSGHVRRISRGEIIISEDQTPGLAHMIVDGWAVRYKSLRDGGRAIIAFLIPGDLCDAHVALLDRMDHSIDRLI